MQGLLALTGLNLSGYEESRMAKVNEIGKTMRDRFGVFMSDKPLWAFLTVYTAFTGLALALLYTAVHLLFLRWWGAAIAIIVVGVFWGFTAHSLKKNEKADRH